MRVLSIDWDYFIDTSEAVRANLFPQGGEGAVEDRVWSRHYELHHEISSIGVKQNELQLITNLLQTQSCPVIIAESHKKIVKAAMSRLSENEFVSVTHIDHHHDMYVKPKKVFGKLTYNCANWVLYLNEIGILGDILWISNHDSHTLPLDASMSYTTELSRANLFEYDLVFICKSSPWSPPHLDDKWIDFIAPFEKEIQDKEVLCNRKMTMNVIDATAT